jgi:hypothetical protein
MTEQQSNNKTPLFNEYQPRHLVGDGYQPIAMKTETGVRAPIVPPTGGTGARTIQLKPIILNADPR